MHTIENGIPLSKDESSSIDTMIAVRGGSTSVVARDKTEAQVSKDERIQLKMLAYRCRWQCFLRLRHDGCGKNASLLALW